MRFVIFVFLLHSFISGFGQAELIRTEIERIIINDTDIKYEDTPGFIIGIVDKEDSYTLSFGTRCRSNEILDSSDVFELGSITKSFVSSLVQILVNDGVVNLEWKVNNFIGVRYQNPRMDWLTVGDLLNHTSGLPKRPIGFGLKEVDVQNPYLNYTKEDLLNFYSYYVPLGEQGLFSYSHTNYGLLEIVIEQISGRNFNDLLIEKVLQPLKMESSLLDFKEQREDVLTPGMDRTGELVHPWMFRSFAASEGLKSSINDMMKYMRGLLNIKESSFALNLQLKDVQKSFNENTSIQDGWQVLRINKKLSAFINTGSTSGYSAFIGLIPATSTGVVILSNSSFGTGDLGMQILRMINFNWKRKPN